MKCEIIYLMAPCMVIFMNIYIFRTYLLLPEMHSCLWKTQKRHHHLSNNLETVDFPSSNSIVCIHVVWTFTHVTGRRQYSDHISLMCFSNFQPNPRPFHSPFIFFPSDISFANTQGVCFQFWLKYCLQPKGKVKDYFSLGYSFTGYIWRK